MSKSFDDVDTYTLEEAIKSSTEYFKGDVTSATVFIGKYALKNNEDKLVEANPDDMHHRLAREFAIAESKYADGMTEEEIYNLFKNFEYVIPQGSPMSAIGNPYSIQSASNCFVIASPMDSYGGIFQADQQLAQLAKRRGGVGLDLSEIRPKGMSTSNAAKTTDGIAIFMDRFSNTCREVAQGGRRGALLESISVHHPEIETFINIKRNQTRVTGANISIRLTDKFMKAVKNNKTYTQQWPVDSKTPKVVKEVKALDVWNQIVRAAWESAEPGILFWDNAIKNTPSDIYKHEGYGSTSTNPCQPAWAKVLTPNGISTMGALKIGDEIWSSEGWTKVLNKWSNGVKKVYQYKTTVGSFYGTEEHRLISKGVAVEAKNCKTIDNLTGNYSDEDVKLNIHDVMDGIVFGDGSVHKASNNLVHLYIGAKDQDYFNSEISSLIIKYRPGLKKNMAYEIETTIQHDELLKTFNRTIPERFLHGDRVKVIGFLRGLFTANGCISGERICLKASSFAVIEQVQYMLSSIGIKSYHTTNKAKKNIFSNGEYDMKESYDVNITTDRLKFRNTIGFIQGYKNERLDSLVNSLALPDKPNKTTYEVKAVNFISEEEVFDITLDNFSHTYWTNGLNVHNCGEIVLSPNDSCRLIALNLYSFVDNKFTENATFDYEKFSEIAYKSQHLMDSMVDIELGQVDKIIAKIESDPEPEAVKAVEINLWRGIREAARRGRRTGLGITGLGDALAALNVRYGSPESIEITEAIYRAMAVNAYKATIDMAEIRGKFEVFDYELEKDHSFVSNVVNAIGPEYVEKWKKFGRRNIALTTTAPAGSVSMMTQTTSGIEPAFRVTYTRRRKINPSDSEVIVTYVDAVGDKFTESKIFHHAFKDWMNVTGKTEEQYNESPYFNATANDVDWRASVDIQAAAQKWVCHSISKTCNLPSNVTEDLVSQVYMDAWEKGCKGFTVYRDGCRSGILIDNPTESVKKVETPKFVEINAVKRPETLECEVSHVRIKSQQWVIFVGLYDGKPYEVFGGIAENIQIPKKIRNGHITKIGKKEGRGVYSFAHGEGEEKIVVKDIVKAFADESYAFHTLAVSGLLRTGMGIKYVLDILNKADEEADLYSFNKVISRVLKHHIKDGTKSGEKCPQCGSDMIFTEGCKSCSCGYSKC